MKDEKYEELMKMKEELFKRGFGVTKEVFEKMVKIYKEYEEKKMKRGGRPSKLTISTKVIIMLEYYKEYRTQFNMSLSYGVSEATISRVINEVEDELMKSGEFTLPGKKELIKESELEIDYVIVDVTEITIERPKKNKKDITVERKKDIQSKDK